MKKGQKSGGNVKKPKAGQKILPYWWGIGPAKSGLAGKKLNSFNRLLSFFLYSAFWDNFQNIKGDGAGGYGGRKSENMQMSFNRLAQG